MEFYISNEILYFGGRVIGLLEIPRRAPFYISRKHTVAASAVTSEVLALLEVLSYIWSGLTGLCR